ncbi:AraC family transcriptional regulator [Streptomyces sp. NPDC097619]|uniref:AraC family transcriptional regulator n=1 Tax=Streptomyces sp. NPDC097619 TaxID=3157228 RepID=UPI003317AD14
MSGARAAELPLHRLEVPMPQLLPFAIGSFETIGPLSRAEFPHRHSFYEILHVTGGTGGHVQDLRHTRLDPPHLCVITPGQVHHWERARGVTGHVVLFEEDFLLHPQDAESLRVLGTRPWLRLGDRAPGYAALLADMETEYATLAEGYAGVLRSLLHILVVRALRDSAPSSGPEADRPPAGLPSPVTTPAPDAVAGAGPDGSAAPAAGRAGVLTAAFRGLLARPEGPGLSVADCAQRLGVSPGSLHALVKQATGRTPGQLIRQRQTLEAKRLLAATDLTVRQVGRAAGFADPAYFCRFFRRETGLTPGEFRAAAEAVAGPGGKHHDPRIESIAALADRP